MKKLLIASTALVATAGIAAADIAITGYAEMGMADLGDAVGVQMHSDMDVTFKLSGASDNGLTFGASIDLDEVSSGINSTGGSQAIHVSGAFGTLTMGDTDGALDKANAEVASLTAIADDHTAHSGYNGGAGLDANDILRYDTTLNGFGISASLGQSDVAVANDVMGYGVTTTVGTVALSAAYQSNNTQNITAVSAKTTVGGLTITGNYSEAEMGSTALSYEHTGLGVNYDYNGVALHANMGSYDYDNGTKADGMGVAANYGLGGGATVMIGYGNGKAKGATASVSTFSVGLGLSF
jgi:outer membrane protein OmpU